ncbi:MAG: GNAT family N-acetyltransferase [Oscillospiraceae bacterium]|jgi:predicted N-acetyltransferase YhbS|nr:GNAT family N-acetyltransferase [Oscillospiraceae bacterium]
MSMNYTLCKAKDADHDAFLTLINDVFEFDNQPGGGFLRFLPKLYKKEYTPCANNFVVYENGRMYAAVGLYYNTMHVCGKPLLTAGIGNVAVHKDRRGAGYMKEAMRAAIADMKEKRADFSFLGGRRQRYMYFSYDHAVTRYQLDINQTSMAHALRGKEVKPLKAVAVTSESTRELDDMHRLQSTLPLHMERPREAFFDIIRSWSTIPYAAYDGGRFAGYFLFNSARNHILEFYPQTANDILPLIACALGLAAEQGEERSIEVVVPEFDANILDRLLPLSEIHSIDHGEQISILNYKTVIEAFLHAKATYTPLPDGEVTLLIHGEAGDEQLRLAVRGGKTFVETTSAAPNLELTHLEAVRLVGSVYSEKRKYLPPACAAWFPLPITFSHVDSV